MEILQYGDPGLHLQAEPVTELGPISLYVPKMREVMLLANGAGLAATQVGIRKRFFLYDLGDGLSTVINPEIVETQGIEVGLESCLSVPFPVIVQRFKKVTIQAVDVDGREVVIACDGILSRLVQHEIDHLNGVLTPQIGEMA